MKKATNLQRLITRKDECMNENKVLNVNGPWLSDEQLLTIKETSEYLRAPINTLYSWVWQRRIAFVKIGKLLRFKKKDLDEFIRRNSHKAR